MKKTWFISHPSGGIKHTPTFFSAINDFVQAYPNIEVIFPHASQEEVQLTKDAINKVDMVIVEVSIPSTGSGIELGWANAAGKPIVAFHQGGSEPSPAVQFVTSEIHVYVTEEHITEVLQKFA
jgi:nucleoside 2-deoxyribosyltransferase